MEPFYVHTPIKTEQICGTWCGNEDTLSFCLHTGQKLMYFDINELTWHGQMLLEPYVLMQFESLVHPDGTYELYGLAEDGRILEIHPDGALSSFVRIQKNIGAFIFDRQHQGQVGLVVKRSGVCQKKSGRLYQGHDSGLAFLYEDRQSGDWGKRAVVAESSDEFWVCNSYVSELAFTTKREEQPEIMRLRFGAVNIVN